jgi:hypothetical protein
MKFYTFTTSLLLLFLVSYLQAQVGINTTGADPDGSAMLDISSTDKGALLPRMSDVQRDAIPNPATGLTVFVTTDSSYYYFDGTAWNRLLDNTDAQDLSSSSNGTLRTIDISGGTGTTINVADRDNNSSNEIQDLYLQNDFLRLTKSSAAIDISGVYQDLSLNGNTLRLSSSNNTVDLSKYLDTLSIITDADGDTKIQVEESADEDMIRFDVAGTEVATLDGNGRLQFLNNNTSVFIGEGAGSSGDNNTLVGAGAGRPVTTGRRNTAVGREAMRLLNTGESNTAIGSNSLFGVGSGSNNTAIGFGAGELNTNGVGNVYIGHRAGQTATGSNKLYIENSNTNSPLIYGEFDNDIVGINGDLGVGTSAPAAELDVNGELRISSLQSHGFTTGSNVIQVGAASASDQWLRFRKGGGVPNGEAGVIFSEFNNDHFFVNNVGDALTFSRSTESSATPDFANSSELLRLEDNGNLGVGTSSPSQRLDVNGKIRMRSGAVNGYIPVSNSNGTMTWTDPSTIGDNLGNHTATQNINLNDYMLSNDGGFDGIYLQDEGQATIWTRNGELPWLQFRASNPGDNRWRLGQNSNNDFLFEVGSSFTDRMIIKQTGEVGIGTSAPSQRLDVNGKIRMRTGASSGYVPVSSSNGTMTWTDPSNILELDVIDERSTLDPFINGSSSTWSRFVYDGPLLGAGTYLVYVSFRAKIEGGSGNSDDVEFRLAGFTAGPCSDVSTTSTGVIENLDEPRNSYQVISFQRVITIPDNGCSYRAVVEARLAGTDDDVRATDFHTTAIKIAQ